MIRKSTPSKSWAMGLSLGSILLVTASTLGPVVDVAKASGETTLILPFRATGVTEVTAEVSRNLLSGELESLGYSLVHADPIGLPICDDTDCARRIGQRQGAERVVYGSLSQLGTKVIVRVRSFQIEADSLDYNDQLNASSIEDLDTVMTRIAEGIASRRGVSSHIALGTVLEDEANEPRLRRGRRGFGVRGGFLFAGGDSYGQTDRLTSFRIPYKFERENFFVETTTLLGLAWGSEAVEWTILDVYAARFFGVEDTSFYLGGGVGIHVVSVEGPITRPDEAPDFMETHSQTATSPVLDFGGGVALLRTYDYGLSLDLRYHIVLEDFDEVGGDGAHGLRVTIGTGR